MQRTFMVLSILLLSSLLISCGKASATSALASTATARPTRTLTPTTTSSPTPTATATLSPVEKIFVIPTRSNLLPDTPTPLATPSLPVSSVKLKNLSEKDALHLIDDLNNYSIQNFPSYDDWWTAGQFADSQKPVALAIQEFLYRFPESPSSDRLRWQLAYIDSLLHDAIYNGLGGNQYDDQWILVELQKRLNQGDVPPDQLESILDQYWFEVGYTQPIENLFGDGKTAWLYVIGPQVWQEEEKYPKSSEIFGRGGLFFVVQQLEDRQFKLHLLANDWSFINGSDSIYQISDHNQNGIPEIALYLVRHGGSMCAGNFKIFEWKDDSFEDLTKDDLRIFDCADSYEYSVVDGEPAILWRKFPDKGASVLTWNGSLYELSGHRVSSLLDEWYFAQSPLEEARAIESILASENGKGVSPSQIDFLRYRLGIAYALNANAPDAKRVLRDLADHPMDTTRTIYSEFAKNFLKYYSGDQSLFLACKKSAEYFYALSNSSTGKTDEELFGISFDLTFGPGLLVCHAGDVFESLITRMPATVNDVAGELRRNGVELYYAQKQDIDLDGLAEEWLIIIDDGIYVVFPEGSGYRPTQIEYFWGADPSGYAKVSLKIERWNGIKDPVLIVSKADHMDVYSIGHDFNPNWLTSEYDMEKILFSSQSAPAQFQVFYSKPNEKAEYVDVPWSGSRWDSTAQVFRQDLLEYILFMERDPGKTVGLVKMILPRIMDWKEMDAVSYTMPRLFYLCGLAYELSGEENKAVEIYWQLWHDFPESDYARLAELKLEPVKP